MGRRIVENVGGFCHLNHKGGATAGQVVRCPYAGENPVDGSNFGTVGRDVRADMGE